MKRCFFLILTISSLTVYSQHSQLFYDSEKQLSQWFDSLFKRDQGRYILLDDKKIAYSDSIQKKLHNILTEENAFIFPFDSLKKLGKLLSSDSLVKVFTWNIKLSNNQYRYYGFILYRKHKNEKRSKVFVLNDYSDSLPDNELEQLTLSHKKWYGANYYQLVTYSYKNQTYYLLIGWDGYNSYINRKVVEVLYFNPRGYPVFGKAVFKSDEKTVKRLIFNHSIKSSMTCRYDEKEKAIIFDHLVPSSSIYKGMYEFYGPNGTFDAYYLKNNIWIYNQDIKVKNPPPKK